MDNQQSMSESTNTSINSNQSESQISIFDLVNMAIAYWWLIIILALIFGSTMYTYTKLTSIPQYTSVGTLYVNTQNEQKTDDVNAKAIESAQSLMPTYIKILESKSFLTIISDDLNNRYSYSQIAKMTNLGAMDATNLLSISVTSPDSHDAYLVCNSIMNNAPIEIVRVFEGGSVKWIDLPEESFLPRTENAFKKALIGMLFGIALALGIIFLINIFDNRVKSTQEITNKYKYPILGEIPNIQDV